MIGAINPFLLRRQGNAANDARDRHQGHHGIAKNAAKHILVLENLSIACNFQWPYLLLPVALRNGRAISGWLGSILFARVPNSHEIWRMT